MSIEIKNISKTFGNFAALKNISLRIESDELVALLGPSGSGKTTLLRIIAGLEQADSDRGSIYFHDENVSRLHAAKRQVGFVFQHYALFRHLTVFENIAFGLRVRPRAVRPSRAEIRDKVMQLLRLIQMEPLADRRPSQLSGGQRQRVALARALAVEPRVLLLDEPFGALDAKVRKELRHWIRRLHDEIHLTSVFVTHDQEEALEVADRVVLMNEGRIEQIGTPEEVYDHPVNEFVYNFLGNVNIFEGRLQAGRFQMDDARRPTGLPESSDSKPARAYVRPYDIELMHVPDRQSASQCVVRYVNPAGPVVRVEVQPSDSSRLIQVELSRARYRELHLEVRNTVYYRLHRPQIFADDYCI